MSNPLAPIIVDQIMREHMERASTYRRATSVRALRERPTRTAPRVRQAFGALVGRPAA